MEHSHASKIDFLSVLIESSIKLNDLDSIKKVVDNFSKEDLEKRDKEFKHLTWLSQVFNHHEITDYFKNKTISIEPVLYKIISNDGSVSNESFTESELLKKYPYSVATNMNSLQKNITLRQETSFFLTACPNIQQKIDSTFEKVKEHSTKANFKENILNEIMIFKQKTLSSNPNLYEFAKDDVFPFSEKELVLIKELVDKKLLDEKIFESKSNEDNSLLVIKDSNISFVEIEKYDEFNETGKFKVLYLDKEVGILTATGHPMSPVEFKTTSIESLKNLMLDFKQYLSSDGAKKSDNISFENNRILFDDELVAEFENGALVNIDEDELGYFINDISSFAEPAEESKQKNIRKQR